MAYKNKKANKKHIADLKETGWRKDARKNREQRKFKNNLNAYGISDQKQIESIMRMQGLI